MVARSIMTEEELLHACAPSLLYVWVGGWIEANKLMAQC